MQDVKKEQEFDLKLLFGVLLKFWYVILIATVLLGAIAGGYKMMTAKPTYVASVSFWVSSTGENSSNTMGAAQMATGYVELINSGPKELWDRANTYQSDKDPSAQALNEKWGISINDTYSALGSMVSATKSHEDSLMFTLTVSSSSLTYTYDAIFSIQYVTESVIAEISGVANVVRVSEIFDTSDIGVRTDSTLKYAMLGAGCGLVISYIVCFFLFINRKKIDSADMLADAALASVIGNIPMLGAVSPDSEGQPSAGVSVKTREAFNLIRAALVADGGSVYTLLPVSEEQSSAFVTAGVAESFRETGRSVAVVADTDLDLEGILCKTVESVDGYAVGAALAAAVTECRASADTVLVSAPVHTRVEDVSAVGAVSDGFVLTVGRGDRIDGVEAALSHIERAQGNTVGLCYTE